LTAIYFLIPKSGWPYSTGMPFSTNIFWDRAIEAGRCFGAVHQGLWFDVGTPKSIGETEAFLQNV
jgi:MurNAc alpha-1-phosphate uridylyltransferase